MPIEAGYPPVDFTLLFVADGTLSGLAFDWVQVKIFVATYGGYILACDARPTQRFPCVEILSGLGWFHGIAIDPFER